MEKKNSFKHFYRDGIKSLNFAVNGVGVCETMAPGIVNRPRGTGDSLLMFFHDAAVVNVREEVISVAPGTLIYWEKCRHYYGNTDEPWMHSWIHFDGRDAYEIMRNAGLHPFRIITPPAWMVEKLLTEIDREMVMASPDICIVRDRFEIFIREIVRAGGARREVVQPPARMIALRQYIEDNYSKSLSLERLARKFSISPAHLSAEFKRWFGVSPGRYLIEYRLHEAEILLKDNNLRIADVAGKVGWDDVYHFSKIFKSHCGVSPSAMRRKYLNPE